MKEAIFIALAILSSLMAVACVTTKHLLRSAVFLMTVLTMSAGLYIILDTEFLAGVQVLVYVGGVVVLLVFAIMMTKTDAVLDDDPTLLRRVVGGLTALAFFALNALFVFKSLPELMSRSQQGLQTPLKSEVSAFGQAFLDMGSNGYVFPFELISFLLLAVLIGGIVLARSADTKGAK